MDGHHCGGCRGYTAEWAEVCPGLAGVWLVPRVLPPLRWRDRWKALAGQPVPLTVTVRTEAESPAQL